LYIGQQNGRNVGIRRQRSELRYNNDVQISIL
jgi:hypothetical protein